MLRGREQYGEYCECCAEFMLRGRRGVRLLLRWLGFLRVRFWQGRGRNGPFDNVSYNLDYSKEELASAPQEAAEFSLGCGNPIAMANLKPGEVVLDIGSGGGLDSFLAAGMVGPEGRVIGVDMTPAMLERARGAAQRTGITNVEFRQGLRRGAAGGRRQRGCDPLELRDQPDRG